ncbi:CRISPR-associated helicase Cas3' [Mesorhizobium sp. M0060]|uniref:CRISPR-associated helicase Cas3' n=1 Tax=Mesorhizobium sp. M0060 TaxID=2956866 RepID=UPI0033366C4E
MYYAHSTAESGRFNWQPLSDHLIAVAVLAQQFGAPIGIGRAAWLAGLLHDVGKYTPEFQARLSGAEERVDHSTAGAAIVTELAAGDDRPIAELVAYAIAGHHAGLPDKQGESLSTLEARLRGFSEARLDKVWASDIKPDASGLKPDFCWHFDDKARFAFQLSFLGRMIFSCLVDADFKDTEQFYARTEGRQIDRTWPELQSILPSLIEVFDTHMRQKRRSDTPVNVLRANILDHVRPQASEKPGLFTLTVPTGGGKTLASLGFALDHAKMHGLDRIIYAIPFTSIIDQTASIFRGILGDDVVLEHHSAIEDEERRPRDADSTKADKDKLKLAMEDWAAPIVVTTNVQLFESLFAARTSRCRKLHNIARSVIILDEAQTLPRQLLIPAIWALRELAENYGCSIVLCTATQPALDQRNFPARHPVGLPLEGRELAPDPADLAKRLERVMLVHGGVMDDAALLAQLGKVDQALVIVNSRKHALTLYRQAKETGLDGLVHLTTRQYAAHRREILAIVRQKLMNGEPCRVIATSLVEAGVDLDFPKVWRAEAGLDQVAQAAGRCNREGRRSVEDSMVTIFKAPENPPPAEIAGLSGDMARMMARHEKLLSPAAIEDFFSEVYWRVGPEGLDRGRNDKLPIVDKFRIGSGGTNFSYRSVAENFRMIDSGMVPVIIPGDGKAKAAIAKLETETIPSGVIARDLQTYVVQVPPKARARLITCGHVKFAAERLRADQFAVLMTPNLYDPEVGLVWEDAEYLSLEAIVI